MEIRSAALAAAAWLAAVSGVAGVSWLAVDAAGRQLVARAAPGLHGSIPDPDDSPPVEGSPSVGGTTRSTGGVGPTGGAGSTGGTTTYGGGATGGAGDPPGTAVPRTTEATATALTGYRSTAGGTLAATCLGTALGDWSARPADGWAVEHRTAGAAAVTVEFTRPHGEDTELVIAASCAGGRPVFDVHQGD